MKKIFVIFLLLFINVNYGLPQGQAHTLPQKEDHKYTGTTEKRKGLWKEFHKARYPYFGKAQKVDLYAENHALTRICFICDHGLYIFYWQKSEARIEKIEPAKFLKYDQINRIIYEKNGGKGFFQLWHYETMELSIRAR